MANMLRTYTESAERMNRLKLAVLAACLVGASAAHSQTIVSGLPYSIEHDQDQLRHVLPGSASEYNSFNDELQTAYALFSLAGLPQASNATLYLRYEYGDFDGPSALNNGLVSFGLFAGDYTFAYTDFAYNVDPAAFLATDFAGTFSALGSTPGLILGLDVSTFYNLAVSNGYGALQIHPDTVLTSLESISFDKFSLVITPVPEPETYALLLVGLAVVSVMARRRVGRK